MQKKPHKFYFHYLGQIPGRPQGGRHGMIFGHISVPSTIGNSNQPLVPGSAPLDQIFLKQTFYFFI
jgi:hypothetical protein